MKIISAALAAPLVLSMTVFWPSQSLSAESSSSLVRETLRQQSAAERSSCAGVQRTISSGSDPTLVVRTAVELGYNSCQVIRCALEEKSQPDKETLCEKVIRGAVSAGVPADVISRCSADVCDPSAVAAILSATRLEPNYCYFYPRLDAPPLPAPRPEPAFDRSVPQPEASPYTFR